MSDEEIYRQISELEKQIAELRGKLPSPPEWKAPKLREEGVLEQQERGQPFRIHSEEELELKSLPDLARQILDALKVQVYIKKAEIDEVKNARKYLYVNQTVRAINKWTRAEALTKFDRDVFLKGHEGDRLYLLMKERESATIKERHSRQTNTDFSNRRHFWSRNDNLEIPILDQDDECIGFCSLAQNIVFQEAARAIKVFQKSAWHNIANLKVELFGLSDSAREMLQRLISGPNTKGDSLTVVAAKLDLLRQWLLLYSASSKYQTQALDEVGGVAELGVVETILSDLVSAYKDCGFTITCTINGDRLHQVHQPKVVKGILSVFIGNAFGEHQAQPPDGSAKQCNISCCISGGSVRWQVQNPCLDDRKPYVVPDTIPDTPHSAAESGFDKVLLAYLVLNSFPGKKPSEMITTSKTDNPSEFTAVFEWKEQGDGTGNC